MGCWSRTLRSWHNVRCAQGEEQGAGTPQQRPTKGGVLHGGSEAKVVCLHGKRQSSGTKSLARRSSETNYGPGDRVMTAGGRNAFVEQICGKWLEETES